MFLANLCREGLTGNCRQRCKVNRIDSPQNVCFNSLGPSDAKMRHQIKSIF